MMRRLKIQMIGRTLVTVEFVKRIPPCEIIT
jgi:hypothetical protein